MRAAVAERPGPLGAVLAVREVPGAGSLAPHEVSVRMIAAAVNPSDAVTVSGAYASRITFPFVPGFEGVGVIERAGPGVPEQMIGRRVLPIGSAGCWAERKQTPLSWCIPVPEDLPDAAAGTAYINPLTAWLMVERFCAAGVREVVITAATSTIAGHLAQLLSARGITPIGLVRGTPGREVAEPSLWRDVLATSDPAWPDRLRHVAGGRTDVVLDCVGGAQGALLMVFLAPGGVLVHYGLLSGEPLPRACFDGRRGTRVELFHLRETVHSMPRHELPALFGPVFEHLRAGRLLTPCAQEVPLSRLPDALRAHRRRPAGKLLVDCRR